MPRVHYEFSSSLAAKMRLLESKGYSRSAVSTKAGFPSRNMITNIIDHPETQPTYVTVNKLVKVFNELGVLWRLEDAEREAGLREPIARTTPIEYLDRPPMVIASMFIPVYDATVAGRAGITDGQVTSSIALHSTQIAMDGLTENTDEITLIETVGEVEPADIVVARNQDGDLEIMSFSKVEKAQFAFIGKVIGFFTGPESFRAVPSRRPSSSSSFAS